MLPGARVTTELRPLSPRKALAKGARALVIGVANSGGVIPDTWLAALVEALESGLDIISGLHAKLVDIPVLRDAADRTGRRLIDIRTPPAGIEVTSGAPRYGRRTLTVGTDRALGKNYTAQAVVRRLRARGIDADFRATGQTGLMIAGACIPINAVVADFVAGAAEMLGPAADPAHVDVIEGQARCSTRPMPASHSGFSTVASPTCSWSAMPPGRTAILGHPGYHVPSIADVIAQTIALGRLTNPAIKCAGISLNTAELSDAAAAVEIAATAQRFGLPAADPIRGGDSFERLLDACMP